ncbi:MAG: hypothetical protein QOG43_2951 [Actinomycetota bacterium]|jgi:hypothetical protein|nr:hypothetical protein [Actinomycetota bacterium]
MDQAEVALLRRVRMTVADAASARCVVDLDGWPLLLVDRIGGCVQVNDLRSEAMFSHGVRLPSEAERLTVRAGAVGDELFVLVGDAVAVFVVPDVSSSTHVEVRVVESATGRLLFDRSVRYRQMPAGAMSPSPALLDCRG